MKCSTKVLFLSMLLVVATGLFLLRHARNDFFEYCTTRAYGLPLPWRVDNCECDGRGGLTEYPGIYAVLNCASGTGLALLLSLAARRFIPST